MALFRVSQSLDPVRALLALQRDLDRAFQNPSYEAELGVSGRGVYPAINVFSDAEGHVVRVEVPGLSPEQLKIEANGNTLTIAGTREITAPEGGAFHRRERDSGAFSRSIQLPRDLDLDRCEAVYRQGVLTVRIPKRAAAKARQIVVQPT